MARSALLDEFGKLYMFGEWCAWKPAATSNVSTVTMVKVRYPLTFLCLFFSTSAKRSPLVICLPLHGRQITYLMCDHVKGNSRGSWTMDINNLTNLALCRDYMRILLDQIWCE